MTTETVTTLARMLCDDAASRRIAKQLDAPSFDDSAPEVQEYWRALARLASEARSSSSGEELPADVRRLVVAARRALEATDWASNDRERRERLRTLDQASEAFASRVPWDDAPAEAQLSEGDRALAHHYATTCACTAAERYVETCSKHGHPSALEAKDHSNAG